MPVSFLGDSRSHDIISQYIGEKLNFHQLSLFHLWTLQLLTINVQSTLTDRYRVSITESNQTNSKL